jgi:small-conductance mechanosensitive channel
MPALPTPSAILASTVAQTQPGGGEESMMNLIVLGNPADRWFNALIIAGVAFGVLILVRMLLVGWLRGAKDTPAIYDDVVLTIARKFRFVVILILSMAIGSLALSFSVDGADPEPSHPLVLSAAVLALLVQLLLWGNAIIDLLSQNAQEKDAENVRVTTIRFIAFGAKLGLFALVLVLALDNLGIDVSTLIAGLGIGGIAIALATQKILGDLIASLSIVLDRPFQVGDFIIVGDVIGSVENIGLKTTRVRSLTGETIVVPNSDVLSSRIKNYRALPWRQYIFKVGLTYETPLEKLKEVPKVLQECVEGTEGALFKRAHFVGFGASTLDFEVMLKTEVVDYAMFLDLRQAINLAIVERFAELGVEFAYPTQTIWLNGTTSAGDDDGDDGAAS